MYRQDCTKRQCTNSELRSLQPPKVMSLLNGFSVSAQLIHVFHCKSATPLPLCAMLLPGTVRSEMFACAGKAKKAAHSGQGVLKQLGKQRVSNLFTHLRKIAQHPLLVRNLFTDAQVQRLVMIAYNRQEFFLSKTSLDCVCTEPCCIML